MRFRTLFMAGAVFPFALGLDASAQQSAPLGLVIAQAEQPCPEGADCPPVAEPEGEPGAGQGNRRQRAIERALRRQQELEQQGAEQAEQPAPEQPAPEGEAAEAPAEEPPPPEQAPAAEAAPAQTETPPPETPAEAAAEPPAETTAEQPAQELQGAPADQVEEVPAEPEQQRAAEPAPEPAAEAGAEQPSGADAPEAASTTEQQLEAQGDQEQADRIRELRRKLRRERREAEAAAEDDDAGQPAPDTEQAAPAEQEQAAPAADREDDEDEGREIRRGQRWRGGGVVIERRGDRVIIQEGDRIFIQPVVPDESERLLYGARDVEVEELRGGLSRTIVHRENGVQIITVRDRDGNIVRRVRRTPDGREFVLIDNRLPEGAPPPRVIVLPPPVITIPQERYIVDIGRASPQQLEEALLAPPVQAIERPYTLQEVTRSENLRAYLPRIDLDTITFEFGSATIGSDQMPALAQLGVAMENVIAENPDEVYLIEGHTDAVGSDYDNLILSDRRAEAVAVALSQNFDIPPENLVTEGYGEQYLKVPTEGPARENRRVTVRRITPLLQTSEAAQ